MPPSSLRIALISEHASPLATVGGVDAGGQNIYVEQVARALARRGHQVDVLTRRDAALLPPAACLQAGVRVLHIDAGPPSFVPKEQLLQHMPEFTRNAMRRLASEHFDLLHANFFMSGMVGLQLARRFDIPLAVTFHALGLVRRQHQGSADGFPPQRIAIEHQLVQQAEMLIAECPQDRDDLLQHYGADAARIATIPCGVDTQLFAPGSKAGARHRLGWSDDEFVVLQLGRLVPRKGIDNVIQALARLPHEWRLRLVVVGGDTREPDAEATPEIGRLQALAQEAGVADRVTFTGHRRRAELPDFYVGADVFVTTPWYEPFGITPLEAMACGTPVIGSAVGGIRHTVAEDVTGYLVPPRDPDALARQLRRLYANPLLARCLGEAGVERVRSQFTWDHVAQELLGVYRALVRPRRLRLAASSELARPTLAAEAAMPLPELASARLAAPMLAGSAAAVAGLQN